MSLLDELKNRISFRKDPPVVYTIENAGPTLGWSERHDDYGRVVRLEFNCPVCKRGNSWVNARLEPLRGEFGFNHCNRTDRYVIGQGPVKPKPRDPELLVKIQKLRAHAESAERMGNLDEASAYKDRADQLEASDA